MNTLLSSRTGHCLERLGILLLVVALAMGTTGCTTDDSGEPTEIWTWNDLNTVRDNPGGSYILMNDLDEATAGYDELVGDTADGQGWQPIGTAQNPFKGTFDGNGNTISGLFIYRPDEDEVGLFGRVQEGLVKNVGLVSVNVTGKKSVGALVGYSWKGTLDSDTRPPSSKTYSDGSVTGEENVGGLVGNNYRGIVNQCQSNIEVFHLSSTPDEERWRAGGLVGLNSGPVINCNYSGEVNGDRQVGGLVGQNAFAPDARVEDCGGEYGVYGNLEVGGVAGRNLGALRRASFNGTVRAFLLGDGLIALNEGTSGSADSSSTTLLGSYVGGVVGVNEGIVEDCSAQATVEGYRYVGGLTGTNNGTLEGCSATATVKGYQYVGGLAGANAGNLASCSSSGDVTGSSDAGRLVGYNMVTGTVSNSDSASCVTGAVNCGSLVGRDEAEPWDYVRPLNLHCVASPMASVVRFAYVPWAQAVGNATGPDGGKFSFNFTYDDTPYWYEDSLTALGTGAADLGLLFGETFHLGSIGYLPFFFPDMASCAYATYNLLATEVEDWDTLGELGDVKILLSSPLEPVHWWGNVPITTLADLDGVRVGCHPWLASAIEALGATAVEIEDRLDLAAALSEGSIDGCFGRYQGGLFVSGLRDVTQYNTEVNLHAMLFLLAMNRAKYENLHPDARALLDTFCGAEESAEYAETHYACTTYYKDIVNEWRAANGQQPSYVLPQEELDNWKAACASVAPDWVDYMDGLGFDGQGIYERAQELIAEYRASASYDNTPG